MTEATQEATFKVAQEDARGRVRVIFEGLEADARKFLSDNFPRLHVEPGSPDTPAHDAVLVAPDGSREVFNGPETGFAPHPDDEQDTQIYDDVQHEREQQSGPRSYFGGNR